MTNAIDESLFGLKDFGELTLLEFANLCNGMWESFFTFERLPDDPERTTRLFREFLVSRGVQVPDDAEHKYAVKFEIMLPDDPAEYPKHPVFFSTKIWADDCLVESEKSLCAFETYKTRGGIHYLNAAHEKLLAARDF